MHPIVFLLVILSGLTSSTVVGGSCPSGWTLHDKSCYQLSTISYFSTYESAKWSCNYDDGYLADVMSEEENDFLKNWLKNEVTEDDLEGVWLGASAKRWVGLTWDNTDAYLDFTDWTYPNPSGLLSNEAVTMLPAADYQWRVQSIWLYGKMQYVCETCAVQTECFNGSCYKLHCLVADETTRTDKCASDGDQGVPAQINSDEERQFIKKYLEGANAEVKDVFVGVSDDYAKATGLINGASDSCMVIRRHKDGWLDETPQLCSEKSAYLCEFKKPKTDQSIQG